MKLLQLPIILLLIITSQTFARENPFSPTNSYNEEYARIIEKKEVLQEKLEEEKLQNELKNSFITNEILPFVGITYNDTNLIINTDYTVLKKFTINKEKKIIIDYKAKKKDFYTKKSNLDSKNFKQISIGNHKKKNFFRVVIEVSEDIKAYNIDKQDSLITLIYSKK